MRLTDLLHSEVTDADGLVIGTINDVRLVQDGPLLEGWGAALRVEGLVIGRRRTGSNLGYDRSNVRGPWIVSAIVRHLHRDDRYARWDQVSSHAKGDVRLSCAVGELSGVPRLADRT